MACNNCNSDMKSSEELLDSRSHLQEKAAPAEDECNRVTCGTCSTALGCSTRAFGDCSLAEGGGTKAYGSNSHAEGNGTTANGDNSHAEGCSSVAYGSCSHAEGYNTQSYGDSSHTEGYFTKARGARAHAEGSSAEANGDYSHAQGINSKAEGYASVADGYYSTARGSYSHTEGNTSTTNGPFGHAEGYYTQVDGYSGHAEGANTLVKGSYSHAEGYNTIVNGSYAHAEGGNTLANGAYSHAEGVNTLASGYYSHAEGIGTNTRGYDASHIMGVYGDADTPYSWFLGGGTSDANRSLAAKILYTGNAYIKNAWNAGGANYAELFESVWQSIDPGYFVTLDGDKIQVARGSEGFVLGVTTSEAGFVANNMELATAAKAANPSGLASGATQEIKVPAVKDNEGKEIESEKVVELPAAADISAIKVAEPSKLQIGDADTYWSVVALLGQVVVFDDGTCKPNGYCMPNESGIATDARMGYRVLKRLCNDQIVILFR